MEAGKSRKQKRTAKQLYADLVALGFDGSYTRVAAFAREWKRGRQLRRTQIQKGINPALDHAPRGQHLSNTHPGQISVITPGQFSALLNSHDRSMPMTSEMR